MLAAVKQHLYNLHLILFFLISVGSSQAYSQDVIDMFGYGAEVKVHGGAGILSSRGPAANYYNPANLSHTNDFEPYYELAIIRTEYTYTYPQFVPVKIRRVDPIPFLGFSYGGSACKIGLSLIPLPGSSSEQIIEGVPTRTLSQNPTEDSKPSIVTATSSGNGFGYKASIGLAYNLDPALKFGLSLLIFQNGSDTEITDYATDEVIATQTSQFQSTRVILGYKGLYFDNLLRLGLTLKLPATINYTGETSIDALGPEATADTARTEKGPFEYGIALAFRMNQFIPFLEYRLAQWSNLEDQEGYVGIRQTRYDYFDASRVIFGGNIVLSNASRFTFAYGIFQSHLGEGIFAAEAVNDEELVGMQIQNIDAIPHQRYAIGYRYGYPGGHLQLGLFHMDGTHDVWAKSAGYGNYKLQIFGTTIGGTHKF